MADKKLSSEKSSGHNAESGMAAMQLQEIKELLLAQATQNTGSSTE